MQRPPSFRPGDPQKKPSKVLPIAIILGTAAIVIGVGALVAGGSDDDKQSTGQDRTPTPAAGGTSVPGTTPTAVAAGGTTPTPAAAVERLLFMSDRDGKEDIYTMNADGSAQTRLTSGAGVARLPNALLDGSRIVFVSDREAPGSSELYLMGGDGSGQKRLPSEGVPGAASIKLEPNFSPDGSRIVFEVKRGDNYDVFVIATDGTGLTNLTNSPTADIDPVFSPDGARIAFGSDRMGSMDLWLMDAKGGSARRVSTGGFNAEPAWAPDGKRIVFQSNRTGNFNLFVINDDGTGLRQLTDDPGDEFDPAWSPDGTRIAYTSARGNTAEVSVINVDGTGKKDLTTSPARDSKPAWTTVRR
jgi:Tol biopolymer transport system component